MFRSIFLFLFISLSFIAVAQKKDYFHYNKQVQKAENYIVDSSYSKALKVYKKLYKKYDKTFVRDDINAMVCALLVNDYASALFFDKRRIVKNTPLPPLMETEWKKYQTSEVYLQAIKELDSLKLYGEQVRKDNRLVFLYDSLAKKDQEVRQKPNYINGKDTTILITDSLNVIFTINLLKDKGYPSDVMWGKTQPFDIVLRHNTQYLNGTLLPFIYEEVKKGNYDVYQYCQHYDEWFRHYQAPKTDDREQKFTHFLTATYFTGAWGIVDKKLYRLKHNKVEEKKINRNRKMLGLATLQQAYNKQLFFTKDKRFMFKYIVAVSGHGSPQGRVGKYFENILPKYFELVPLHLIGTSFIEENKLIK
jgi:hypothetical protein